MPALLIRRLPEKARTAREPARPLYLDDASLDTPCLALSHAAREILRMGDLTEALLRPLSACPGGADRTSPDRTCIVQARRLGRELDVLHGAIKGDLARLDRTDPTERDMVRLSDLLEFAVNLGHAGDILERRISDIAAHPGAALARVDADTVRRVHARVMQDPRLARTTMMTEDQRSARELVEAKRAIAAEERSAVRGHLARLGGDDATGLDGSRLFLATLRDLRLVNAHLATIGYAVMDPPDMPPTERPLATKPDRVSG